MMGSLTLKVFFAGLCYLTLLAYAAPAASVSSSASGGSGSPSNSSSGYCLQFLDEVNVYQGPWFQGMNQGLSAFCSSSWCNSLSELTPQTTTYEAPVYPPKYQPPNATITTGPTTTEVTMINYSTLPSFVSPCCGQCDITVVSISGAQVMYWPTPAPEPPVESVVDSTGFTYMSPSVYVVFNSLVAHDNCGVVGSLQPNFTTSFGPSELSTVSGDIQSTAYYTLPFNYADLSDCFTSFVTSTYTKEFDTTEVFTTVIPDWETPAVYDLWSSKSERCYPKVAVESWVTDLDPAWQSCTLGPNYVGVGVPIVYASPQPLVGVDGLYNPITTESTTMTTTSAAPSAYPESIATSTATESTPTESAATESTTTAAESTESPTAESTSTAAATTESPTTESPTTESPTTESPMTESPTSESPTSESPTTESAAPESAATASTTTPEACAVTVTATPEASAVTVTVTVTASVCGY